MISYENDQCCYYLCGPTDIPVFCFEWISLRTIGIFWYVKTRLNSDRIWLILCITASLKPIPSYVHLVINVSAVQWLLVPLLLNGFIWNQAWLSNYIHFTMWDAVTYPFPIFNCCCAEVRIINTLISSEVMRALASAQSFIKSNAYMQMKAWHLLWALSYFDRNLSIVHWLQYINWHYKQCLCKNTLEIVSSSLSIGKTWSHDV